MDLIPNEINFGGVFAPPLLVAASLAFILTWATALTLNRYRLSRYFASPPLVFVSLFILYTVVLGATVVRF